MATGGPNGPGTGADDASVGSVAWVNPTNVTADDGTTTTVDLPTNGNQSHYLMATNFGFAIPTSAAILGIQAEWNIWRESLGATIVMYSVKAVKSGAISGSEMAAGEAIGTTTSTFISYGGASSLWGLTWLPSDINASNFGAVLSVRATATDADTQARLDYCRITITYALVGAMSKRFGGIPHAGLRAAGSHVDHGVRYWTQRATGLLVPQRQQLLRSA